MNLVLTITLSPPFVSFLSPTELEAFLVANREEYLRHSALNYTIQQKKYNNRLTERLLDLARSHSLFLQELCPIIEKTRDSPWLCSTQSWNSYASRSSKICKKRRYHCYPSQALERDNTGSTIGTLNPKTQTYDYACAGINEGIFTCLFRTCGSSQRNKKGRKKDDILDDPLLHKTICVLFKK
jgi:hypothetical protein